MCIETTLHVYRNDFDLYRNDLYRNDFVSKRPDTLITGHFFSEAPLLSLTYFANYMNVQKEKNDKSAGHSSKGIPVLFEFAKSFIERQVKEIYSMWLNDRSRF